MIPTLEWLPEGVNFLDQTKLPLEETYVLATDYRQVATVIREMIVRGAPAIGVAAAMGMALGIERSTAATLDESDDRGRGDCEDAGRDATHGGESLHASKASYSPARRWSSSTTYARRADRPSPRSRRRARLE